MRNILGTLLCKIIKLMIIKVIYSIHLIILSLMYKMIRFTTSKIINLNLIIQNVRLMHM